jgi:hypothetical protein
MRAQEVVGVRGIPDERSTARCVAFVLWLCFGVATAATALAYVIGALTGHAGHAITALVCMVPDALLLGGAILLTDRAAMLDGRRPGAVVVVRPPG